MVEALLELQAHVDVIDLQEGQNKEVHYHQINLNQEAALKDGIARIAPNIIYHLAASLDRTRDFSMANHILEVNLNGTINL